MARFTSLEFMDALGLGYMDYNGAKILLRLLSSKGIAKEVGKISLTGKGRKQVVYEIPEEITITVKHTGRTPSHDELRGPPKKKKVAEILAEAVEKNVDSLAEETVDSRAMDIQPIENTDASPEEPLAAVSGEYEWDDGWDDD